MKKTILSSILLIVLVACKKETVTGPVGPAGANGTDAGGITGTIMGKIRQFDQYGSEYTANLNTTTVSIDGTSNSVVTDAKGNYTLSNVASGIYDVSYQKPNCGLVKKQQISFPGNGTLYIDYNISDKATFLFTGGYVKDTVVSGLNKFRVSLNFPSTPKSKSALTILGKTNSMNPEDGVSFLSYSTIFLSANSTSFGFMVNYDSFPFANFVKGDIVYIKVYPATFYNISYYDYVNGTNVFTGCGTPLPTTFTVTMP
jgi:hypothetical protein